MNRKDLLATFKAADWLEDGTFRQLCVDLEPIDAEDILRLLEVLTNRFLTNNERKHRLRCAAFVYLAQAVPDKRLFSPLVRALPDADPTLRGLLADLIAGVNDVSQHGELCRLLGAPEADLRRAAASILTRVGGRSATDLLTEMVSDPSFRGRTDVMGILRDMAGHHAIPAFEAILAVGTPVEKTEAIHHLCEPACVAKARDRVLAILMQATSDVHTAVQQAAIEACAAHATEDEYLRLAAPLLGSGNVDAARSAITGLRYFPSVQVVSLLGQLLRRGPLPLRLAVIDALEGLGTPETLRPLVDALAHRQVAVRVRAGEVLSRLGRAGRVDLARIVLWLLRSTDVDLRRMAIELTQSISDPQGQLWPKLVDFLYDDDWWIRERVIDALIDMGGAELAPHFMRHLSDPEPLRRYYAAEILKRIRAPEALGALIQTANSDSDWLVRERAIEAVALLKDERSVPALVNIMIQEPDLRLILIEALAHMGAKSAAPHVALLLTTEGMEADERLAALRCLDALDDALQLPAARQLLRDPLAEIRELAGGLVSRWEVAGRSPTVAVAKGALLDRLLIVAAEREGDDLILGPDRRPILKRLGKTLDLVDRKLSAADVETLVRPILAPGQWAEIERLRDVDLSYEIPAEALRFRVNVFRQQGGLGAVFRLIRGRLPQLEQLGLPDVVKSLANLKNGLVLVGGPTGSGKSTTLAALIASINATQARHIVTIEDPVEVVHKRARSLVNQRELGTHTGPIADALRATLRQDPDVILVGEMRDTASIAFGLTAAETGHLVFGTIHTVSAATTVDRLINTFPAPEQTHVRAVLSGSLRAVVCQFLHRRRDKAGRCLSVEVLLNNEAIASLIRKGKTFQIPSVITTSRALGMQTMDAELLRLAQQGVISAEDAYMKAASKKEFEGMFAPAGAEAAHSERSA
jgi:twitching motility protein PilT